MKPFCLLLLPLFLAACGGAVLTDPVTLTPCAPMPEARAAATAFVCQGKAYVFGGRAQDGKCRNNIWCYDPVADAWTDLGPAPLTPRLNATACVVRDTAYIGLGYNGAGVYNEASYPRDFWQYVPATGEWKRLPDHISSETNGCVAFAHGDRLYIGCGFYTVATYHMYTYSLRDSLWEQQTISSLQHPEAAFGVVYAACGERCFVGTGFTLRSQTQWLEYLPDKARFVKLAPMPDKGRDRAVAAADNRCVYVCGGQRFGGTLTTLHFYDDIMRFEPETGTWTRVATLPDGGTIAMTAFTIDGKVYCGLGEDRSGNLRNTFYRIDE